MTFSVELRLMVTCLHSWASRCIPVLLNTELRQHVISGMAESRCWPTLLDEDTEAIIKQCHDADNSH